MKIFDNIKKIFKTPTVGSRELGESGTTIFGGHIIDEDYVTALTGSSAIITYDKMKKSDGVIKASLLACELPIRATKWYVEPISEEKKDKDVAEFISQCLFEYMSITWDDFLRQALLMLPFGFSVFEKVFKPVKFNGREMIGWRKFAPRKQASISKWQTENGKDGIVQQLQDGGSISIPIEKLIIFTHRKEGDNWLGSSVLRSAYRSWYYKKHTEKINAMAFERQGLGIPYIVLPTKHTDRDKARAEELLKNVRANEWGYVIIPNGWEMGFTDMKAKTLKDPTATIKRYNREILLSVLAQFLDLGSGNTGSRALSQDHSTVFHNNLTAIARQCCDIINKYAVRQLVDLNYTVEEYPQLKFAKIGAVEYDKIAKALSSLTQQGIITPDEKLEDRVRELMNLPEKPEEEEKEKTKAVPKKKEIEEKEKMAERKVSEFITWRELTFAEKKVNFKDIQSKMDVAEKKLRKSITGVLKSSSDRLINDMQRVLEIKDGAEKSKALKEIVVAYQKDYRKEVYNTSKDMFEYGKMIASHEMKKAVPPTTREALRNITRSADNLTDIMANDLMKSGKLSLLTSLQQKKALRETLAGIITAIRREAERIGYNVPAITIGSAVNQGRRASFDVYEKEIYALQRSEILDSVTCFPTGTKISTIDGDRNIEDIKVGDKVFTHKGIEKVSVAMQRRYDGQMVDLKIGRKKITVTAEHPFWVKGKGWVIAMNLRIGDKFVNFRKNKLLCNLIRFYHQFWNSNNLDIVFSKIRVFASVLFRIFMPIRAVNFQSNPIVCKKKVNRISANFSFLNIFDFEFIQNFSNFLFNRSFTPIFSVARYGTESARFIDCRSNSKRFTTMNADRKNGRTATVFRAKFNIFSFSSWSNYLSTAKTFFVNGFSSFAFSTTKIIPVSIRDWNLKLFFTVRTYLSGMFQFISTSHTAIYTRSCFRRIYQFATSFTSNIFSCSIIFMKAFKRAVLRNTPIFIIRIFRNKGFFTKLANVFSHQLNYSTISQVKQAIVYNLSVANDRTYFANGILVHNCNYCLSIDGRVFKKSDPFTHNDQIHANCRGLWVEIMNKEVDKPAIEGMPKSLRDAFETVNVFKPPRNPIIKRDSLASKLLRKKSAEWNEMDEAQEFLLKQRKELSKLKVEIRDTLNAK